MIIFCFVSFGFATTHHQQQKKLEIFNTQKIMDNKLIVIELWEII